MITAKLITDAWAHCRTTNNSIPDEVLDFMKDVSLAALQSQNSGKPIVMRSLPLTEGAMKTNVKRAVMGLMADPPPPTKSSKDVSGGNDA